MSKTELQQRAHDAAIDHGMWLAPDDDETNYEAFVAGYLRGHSDRGVEATNARDEYLAAAALRDKEIATLRARVAELERMVPRWVLENESALLNEQGWSVSETDKLGNGPRLWLMVPPIPLPEDEG